MLNRVISFSIFGDSKKYCIGLLRNLELAKDIFPDWLVYVYYNDTVPMFYIEEYRKFDNAVLIDMTQENAFPSLSTLVGALMGTSNNKGLCIYSKFKYSQVPNCPPFELIYWFMANVDSMISQHNLKTAHTTAPPQSSDIERYSNEDLFCFCYDSFYTAFKAQVKAKIFFHLFTLNRICPWLYSSKMCIGYYSSLVI
jgi:hypothetical protein